MNYKVSGGKGGLITAGKPGSQVMEGSLLFWGMLNTLTHQPVDLNGNFNVVPLRSLVILLNDLRVHPEEQTLESSRKL